MKTFEVTFCYGKNRGNAHTEVVRSKTAVSAIARAAKAVELSGIVPRGYIATINETLYEVLVREWGYGK